MKTTIKTIIIEAMINKNEKKTAKAILTLQFFVLKYQLETAIVIQIIFFTEESIFV